MGTAQAAGVAIATAARRGLPVALHTPSEVKAAVTGSGRADKAQVIAMVTRVLRLPERPSTPDAADALALAMCHIWRGGAPNRIEAAARSSACCRTGERSRSMIAFVRGPVAAVFADSAVIEVGGIGIQVLCTPAALASLRVGAEANLATSMVVREESLTLYGFADYDERSVFELVQTASGVGPKLAQAMLAVHGPDELRRAIVSEDLATLCAVPGIGRKGAQRIVLELQRQDRRADRQRGRAGPGARLPGRILARPGPCRLSSASAGLRARPTRPSTPWLPVPAATATTHRFPSCSAPPCSPSRKPDRDDARRLRPRCPACAGRG